MHSRIAEMIARDPSILSGVRQRVALWIEARDASLPYALEWKRILDLPVAEICQVLCEDSEKARSLRQASPFAGVLDARERWRIFREAGEPNS